MFIVLFKGTAQNKFPHILVTDSDKSSVLSKIEQQPWARSIYSEMQKKVQPYADRHQTDPQWILSRYLMNRVPGKRYTQFFADKSGQGLIGYGGDAPVPTVRVNTWLRSPVTEKGTSYRKPAIEELLPNDTSRVMLLFNPETNQKEWVDPQEYTTSINADINDLAFDAAIVYWLTGETKYAKFAADILNQWVQGAYYQEPIIGPCRTGFLDMQTLGDAAYRSLILAYDFVKPFMKQNDYDLHWYEKVFEKMASTLAFRGFWNNNWYAAESSTMVFASLSLENAERRDYYLQFFLEKDTINGSCGQLALPSTVEKWLTHDGHWKEPGGYHNYPVGNLLISSLALEKNGYDIFRKFPALFKASYAMLKYSFPNLTVGAFGDTGRASQSAESLEIGLLGAIKYNQPELPEMLASMKKLIDGGRYNRERSGFLGLLCFLPELPEPTTDYEWPRTGTLDFARLFLQRNGVNPETGMMVGVQGATYNHNHCNGMAMELYGCGTVMGIDAGTGANYEHPVHRNYYSQWAAHNTVVAAGSSSSVPFSGSAGSKRIGQIELAAMEPMPDEEAVSETYSFTDTRYFDQSTNTNQSRTLAVIRTSENTGYYVDIYRSDNPVSNDYVYHNIGDQLSFLNEKGKTLQTAETSYPVTEKDYPGFRFFTEVQKLENYSGNLTARFSGKNEEDETVFMQALIAGAENRVYYQARSPKTKTAGRQYSEKTLPVFTVRTEKEATSNPFIVVFEPYKGEKGSSVERISAEKRTDADQFTALTVFNKNGSQQHIFQSVTPEKIFTTGIGRFSGFFGIVGMEGKTISSIYLGKGTEISVHGYSLKPQIANGSACLTMNGTNYRISCNQSTEIAVPATGVSKVTLLQAGKETKLDFSKSGNGIVFTVPELNNAELIIQKN
ncbi:MAG: hypothetical protein A2W92_18905 [Bacteroidetes bacterium GWA2_42_15]|nr:MAG: hypothetical protein A2W92_18905 [Bacteroidetes bacterium GWA2_42_15]